MQKLLKINREVIGGSEVNSINARELWKTLEIKKDFSNWIKAQIESLGLEESVEFITIAQKGDGGKFAPIEYILTLDTAKHIAMASRTKKGKEVRRYFIEVEKQFWKLLEKHKRAQINGYRSQLAQKNKKIALLEEKLEETKKLPVLDEDCLLPHRFLGKQTLLDFVGAVEKEQIYIKTLISEVYEKFQDVETLKDRFLKKYPEANPYIELDIAVVKI